MFFGFSKNRKKVCTLLETNLTGQSLTVQINDYTLAYRQWLDLCSGSWKLNFQTRYLLL